MFLYSKKGWEFVDLPADYIPPVAKRSEEVIVGRDRAIPVHILTGKIS